MENVKIGENRMVPDIRTENIETITESYTPSGGGEQTATYKIINVHPILNGILDKLAFFRTHAAAVWYNKLAGRTVADELKDLNAKMKTLQSEINKLNSGECFANFSPRGNEANFCNGYQDDNGYFYFNYRGATSPIKAYRFCDGRTKTLFTINSEGQIIDN